MDEAESSHSHEISGFERKWEEVECNGGADGEENQAFADGIGHYMPAVQYSIVKQKKVYVVVGKDNVESLSALEWALKTRGGLLHGDSIVLLPVHTPPTFVTTPLGNFPECDVSPDALDAFRKEEKAKMDSLLTKCLDLCSNWEVKADVWPVEKGETHKVIVGLILRLHIRRLVMGTSTSSVLRKIKLKVDKADYVQKHVPGFCKLYIVCNGKLVYHLRGSGGSESLGTSMSSMNPSSNSGFEGQRTFADRVRRKGPSEPRSVRTSLSVRKHPDACIVKPLSARQSRLATSPNAVNLIPRNSGGSKQAVHISPSRDAAEISEELERYFDSLRGKSQNHGNIGVPGSAEYGGAPEATEIKRHEPVQCLDQNIEHAMDSENDSNMGEPGSAKYGEAPETTEITRHEPVECLDQKEHAMDHETLKMRRMQAIEVAKNAKNAVIGEAEKCKRAEWATEKSVQKAKYYEDLYHKEIRQREETRELLRTCRQQMLQVSRRRDETIEELEITGQSLRILGNLVNEVSAKRDHAIQELHNASENITQLKLQIFRNRKERDSALRQLQTDFKKEEMPKEDGLYIDQSRDDNDAIIHSIESEDEDFNFIHGKNGMPNFFLCPIIQDVMQNPHIAADGFTYELESIKGWLESGHDTSPMTNLKLSHKILTPNYTLLLAIRHWHRRTPSLSTFFVT